MGIDLERVLNLAETVTPGRGCGEPWMNGLKPLSPHERFSWY